MISIEKWVRSRARLDAAQNVLVSVVSMVAGLVVLTATFFFTYAIIWAGVNMGASALCQLVAGKRLHVTHAQILIACSVFLVLLFIGNARTSREYLSEYGEFPPPGPRYYLALPLGAPGSLLLNPRASAKLITNLLYIGPRLIVCSGRALLQFRQCLAVDASGCARALEVLLQRPQRVPCTELAEQLADHDVAAVLSQLRRIDGVVFLTQDPPGFTLSRELRLDLLGDQCVGRV
jgi:hypothetical protein